MPVMAGYMCKKIKGVAGRQNNAPEPPSLRREIIEEGLLRAAMILAASTLSHPA